MNNKTILVVEDNVLNMKLVRSILHLGKYEVLETDDGEKGLLMMREHRPDMVLMDIQLPGINGLEVTSLMRQDPTLSDIPVVALTSYAMEGDRQRAIDAGCTGYVTKPIDPRSFLKTIQQYLPVETTVTKQHRPLDDSKVLTATAKINEKYLPKVLIVDDEPLNTKLLAAQIPPDQYSIVCAYSGQEAIEIAENIRPELILLDVMMPNMNGYEVTLKLKATPATSHIPIIMVTALQGTEDKARGLEVGAEEFLSKPVNKTELLARINSMIRLRRYREQLSLRMQSEKQVIGCDTPSIPVQNKEICPATILLVEDNKKDISLIKGHLADVPYELLIAENGEDAIAIVKNNKVDVILLDILLPGINGFEVCSALKKLDEASPPQIVIITSLDDLGSQIKGAELGADDFLIKPINGRIFRARVNSLVRKKKYLDKLLSHYEIAVNSAIMDGLTGLYNHVYLKQSLDMEVKRSIRQQYPSTLIMLDLDNFKRYNDTYGHPAGDAVLAEFSSLLKTCVRETDLVARYGGEEFCVLLPYTDKQESLMVAEKILQTVRNHRFAEKTCPASEGITASAGIASCPSDTSIASELINKADAMLYEAKRAGKDRAKVY
ncbi:MAG: response regulator [Desulfobulbaceae bacterium]|nr:response regulator [Desulfobulbaceae bacterium]